MVRRTLFVITVSLLLASTAQASDWVLEKSSGFSTPGQGQKAKNGLPDGYAAKISRGDIASAWYTQPTRRYRHAILGDDIEAGGLKVSLRNGKTIELSLPDNLVFEDRTPRLHDLDGDGKVEVITARYQAARQLDPSYVQVGCRLGDALARRGRPQDAAAAYRSALDAAPDFAMALRGLGQVLLELQRPEEALPHSPSRRRQAPMLRSPRMADGPWSWWTSHAAAFDRYPNRHP